MVNATETPIDAIFNLSGEEANGFPQEVKVRILAAPRSGLYRP
jgi:hypothetical protein